jgi:hypothetical protein
MDFNGGLCGGAHKACCGRRTTIGGATLLNQLASGALSTVSRISCYSRRNLMSIPSSCLFSIRRESLFAIAFGHQ